MLNLDAAAADRLASAVKTGARRPAVAASLLGLASDEAIGAAMASLYGAPLWDGPAADSPIALPAGLNAKFLAENYAMVLADNEAGCVIGLVDPGSAELRRGVEYALGRPVEFRTILFDQWRAASDRDLAVAPLGDGEQLADAERLKDFASDAPVVRYLDGA
ncbi:MAG TPA: hypothetical protein VGF50_11270, partial [Caulobacteraceae bacterium]